jgi:hypothetical protein
MRLPLSQRIAVLLFAALAPALAFAQVSEPSRRAQWTSIGSLVFFIVVIGGLVYLTAKAGAVRRPPRRL